MGQVTRHEAKEALAKLRKKLVPAVVPMGMNDIYDPPFNKVQNELNGDGPITVRARMFHRVVKHFLEDFKGPDAFHYFAHVVGRVGMGIDPTQAIKRARSELNLDQKRLEERQQLKKVAQMLRERETA